MPSKKSSTQLIGMDGKRGAPRPREKTNRVLAPILSIEEINQFKAADAMFSAIRFDSTIAVKENRRRRVVCKCTCGSIFSIAQDGITSGMTYSCGCKRRPSSFGFTIKEINDKKPQGSLLTALNFVPHTGPHKRAMFLCECGKQKDIMIYCVIQGNTKSCGCFRDKYLNSPKKYSVTIKTLRTCYTDMIGRCYNKSFDNYRIYGAKGVRVCKEWRESYQSFLDWSLANGWKKGLVLDKDIKGNGKLYSPDTCIWTTQEENANYTSKSKKYDYNGENLTIAQIAKKLNVKDYRLRNFLTYGYSLEESIKKVA